MGLNAMILNGWNVEDEMLYNRLSSDEKRKIDMALTYEMENTIPKNRRSFKMIYFLTLKNKPEELYKDRKVTEMRIKLLEDEIAKLKKPIPVDNSKVYNLKRN